MIYHNTLADFTRLYRRTNHYKVVFVVVCIVLAVLVFFISLPIGQYSLSFSDTIDTLIRHIRHEVINKTYDTVIWDIHIPQSLMALLAGAGLGLGGAIMQTTMRNPLADSYTTGVSSGALFGASLFIIYSFCLIPGLTGQTALTVNAFVFSLIPTLAIGFISMKRSVTSSKMILIGIAIMYVFSSLTSFMMVTTDADTLSEVYNWNVGSVAGVSYQQMYIPLLLLVIVFAVLLLNYRKFNVLISGPVSAQTLGVDAKKLIIFGLILVSLLTASIVSVVGTLGFIGLVAPNIARLFVGSEMKYLIPSATAFGAMFLVAADAVSRVATTMGLPVGVICYIIGGPIFIALIIKQRKNVWA